MKRSFNRNSPLSLSKMSNTTTTLASSTTDAQSGRFANLAASLSIILLLLAAYSIYKKIKKNSTHLGRYSPAKGPGHILLLFQRIFIFSLARLIIYINKVYQDLGAVQIYYAEHSFYFAIISLISLVSPSLIYAIYRSFEEIIRAGRMAPKTITTKFVNGLLFILWGLKAHLDELYFASQRLLSFRRATFDEMQNVSCLARNADVLQYFEGFYAGFLQILLQLYIFSMQANNLLDESTFLFIELLSSILSVFSMLIAIRRRDDGILTGALSFIGWIAMFTSRVVVFSLATTIFRTWFVPMCLVHAFGFSIWVYGIAVEEGKQAMKNCFQLFFLVFLFFGLPSLVMWPIMFQLKEKKRPLVFLFVNTIENALLLGIWWFCKSANSSIDFYALFTVLCCTLIADLFLTGYILCKPKVNDQAVLHDMGYTDTESFGMYYEFCDIVFRLKVEKDVESGDDDDEFPPSAPSPPNPSPSIFQ